MQLGGPFFSHYGTKVESITHVLRDCPLSFSIWINVVKSDMRGYFFTSNIKK